jgi:uncharacterized membrane protein
MERTSFPGIAIVIAVVIYIISWSYIDIMRMYSMQDSVFDAGIISLTLNSILFNHSIAYLEYMFGFSLLRIIFSPLILIYGIPGMLIIQEIFLGTPAIIIYKIGVLKIKDRTSALLFSISYLLYFPLAGVNYFDYHFQAFFMFFFLLGYLMFIKERYLLSSIFFFLSGSVRFPYFFFPYLFMLIVLIEEIFRRKKGNRSSHKKIKYILTDFVIFALMLIISAALIYRSPYYIDQEKYFSGYFHIAYSDILSTTLTNINNKVINIVLLFSPLFFIPFRSPKWLLFLIPFAVLSFFNQNGGYTYPEFYHSQYTVTVVPFIFIGLIEGARTIESNGNEENKARNNGTRITIRKHRILSGIKKRKEPIAVICAVVLFAIIFQPYSPVNPYTSEPFDMNIMNPNMPLYNGYINIVNLVPKNDPYVIYQNQLPYVDVHDYDLSCLEAFSTIYGYSNNVSYVLENLTTTDRVDYALGYYQGFSSDSSLIMCKSMNYLYSKGDYGIEAYEYGIVLLARNFIGKPVYYIPLNISGNTTAFTNGGNESISIPLSMMIPGSYNITLSGNLSLNDLTINDIKIEGYQIPARTINFTYNRFEGKVIASINVNKFYGYGYIQFNVNRFYNNPKFNYTLRGQQIYNNTK